MLVTKVRDLQLVARGVYFRSPGKLFRRAMARESDRAPQNLRSEFPYYFVPCTPYDHKALHLYLNVALLTINVLLAQQVTHLMNAQVFKADRMNGFDVQPEADAMLERQQREILPRSTSVPKTPGRSDYKYVMLKNKIKLH